MSCEDTETTTPTTEVVYRGEDKTLNIRISNEDGSPLDLTGVTEITAKFKKEDETVLSLTKTAGAIAVVTAAAGSITVTIPKASTLLLATSEEASFTIMIDIAGSRRIVSFDKVLWIKDPAV